MPADGRWDLIRGFKGLKQNALHWSDVKPSAWIPDTESSPLGHDHGTDCLFGSQQGRERFSARKRPDKLGRPLILRVCGNQRAIAGVMLTTNLPCSAKVKNEWSHTSTPTVYHRAWTGATVPFCKFF